MNLEVTIRDGKRVIRCAKCVGSGTVYDSFKMKVMPCPDCNGSGELEVP